MTWRADWASLSFMHLSFLSPPLPLSPTHPLSLRRRLPPSLSPCAGAARPAPRHQLAAVLRLRPRRRCAPPSHSPPRPATALAVAPRTHPRRRARAPGSPRRPATILAAAPGLRARRGTPPPPLPRRPPWCAAARGFRRRQGQPAAGQGGTATSRRTRSRCARRRGLGNHGLGPRRAAAAASGGARWHNRSRRCSMGTGRGRGCGAGGAHLGSIPAISWGGGWPEGGRRWWGRSSGQPLMAAGGEKFDSGLGKLERGSRSEGGGSGGGGAATHQRNQTAAVGDGRSGRFQHLCSSSGTRVWRKKKEWRLVSVPHQR